MSTVRVYKSTDPGAPAHPGATRGSMAALLRACLVTGYGTGDDYKAPAGWEEPYPESGNYACFRALSGVRQFFQIDDNQDDADVAAMYCFESMSDVQTGSGQWVSSSDTYRYFGKRHSATDAYSTAWMVVADELTCYVFLNGQYGMAPFGFGEFQSYRDDNPYRSFMAGHSISTGLTSSSWNVYSIPMVARVDSTSSGVYLHRGLSQISRAMAAVSSIYGYTNNCPGGAQFPGATAYAGLSYAVLPWEIGSGDGVDLPGGKLRGLYHPACYRPKNHMEQFSHDGKTMLSVNYGWSPSAGFHGQLWVDITGSWV